MSIKEKMMDSMMGNMSDEEKRKMMDAMMGKFFDTMTKEEKQNMMQAMMDKFFGSISAEEKQDMMSRMMPKMMAGMMGKMMSGKKEGDEKDNNSMEFNPMEMCQRMMLNMRKTSEMANYATPEVRALFEEWSEQIENEIYNFLNEIETVDPDKLAEHFKLSKDSINFFLSRLAQKGKIKLKAEKA